MKKKKPSKIGKKRDFSKHKDDKGRFTQGNPGGGRPPGSFSITELVRKELEKVPEGQEKGKEKTYIQLFIHKLLLKAIRDGDVATQKLIWNYMDGLPKESIDLTGKLSISKVLDDLEYGYSTETEELED